MKNSLQIAKNAQYEWNPAFRSSLAKRDIKPVLTELKQIADEYGEITPALIVEASKKKKSSLHGYFEWDNEKAADNWRFQQARYMINCIQVKVIKHGNPVRMQAYQVTRTPSPKLGAVGGNSYNKFEAVTQENQSYVKQLAVRHLMQVKNKLTAHDLDGAVNYINKAIKWLQNASDVIEISSSK